MVPRVLLGTAQVPGGGELRLLQRGAEFSIMLGANELMNSRLSGSEEALAEQACDRIGARPGARMLIGGLGMGFTLRAALARLGADAEVAVAEIVPAVVEWARGPMAALHGDSLTDPRTRIFAGDVAAAIAEGQWDAILLEVEMVPTGFPAPVTIGCTARRGWRVRARRCGRGACWRCGRLRRASRLPSGSTRPALRSTRLSRGPRARAAHGT